MHPDHVMTTNAQSFLRMMDVQLRTYDGDTPGFDGNDEVYAAFDRVTRREARKLSFSFRNEELNVVDLTLENIGTADEPEWVLRGHWIHPDGQATPLGVVPTTTDFDRLLSRRV